MLTFTTFWCSGYPFGVLVKKNVSPFMIWDRWNGDVTPTLAAALLCSSRVCVALERVLTWVVSSVWFEELYKHRTCS